MQSIGDTSWWKILARDFRPLVFADISRCSAFACVSWLQVCGERGKNHPLQASGGRLGHAVLRGPQPLLRRAGGAGRHGAGGQGKQWLHTVPGCWRLAAFRACSLAAVYRTWRGLKGESSSVFGYGMHVCCGRDGTDCRAVRAARALAEDRHINRCAPSLSSEPLNTML